MPRVSKCRKFRRTLLVDKLSFHRQTSTLSSVSLNSCFIWFSLFRGVVCTVHSEEKGLCVFTSTNVMSNRRQYERCRRFDEIYEEEGYMVRIPYALSFVNTTIISFHSCQRYVYQILLCHRFARDRRCLFKLNASHCDLLNEIKTTRSALIFLSCIMSTN